MKKSVNIIITSAISHLQNYENTKDSWKFYSWFFLSFNFFLNTLTVYLIFDEFVLSHLLNDIRFDKTEDLKFNLILILLIWFIFIGLLLYFKVYHKNKYIDLLKKNSKYTSRKYFMLHLALSYPVAIIVFLFTLIY